jgi:NADPH:quinone reductase-like Zn-dependent oxidoreductase
MRDMRAAYAVSFDHSSPLDGLRIGERPAPEPRRGWTTVAVKAASLNHHDLWTLRGVGLRAEQLPMILGCDAAGVDTATGAEVVVHSVIPTGRWSGDETLDPGRTQLSEKEQGTLAELVSVPVQNLVPKPPDLSFTEAACLPTAWLTAYRMLFTNARLSPGQTVLVQGATGGVASACIMLARAGGFRVWATARTPDKQQFAIDHGAHAAVATGERLPDRVDAVMETVGAATWSHSLKALRPGGRLVISGATTGFAPPAELNRIFFLQLNVIGSTLGTRAELEALISLLAVTGVRPPVQQTVPLADVRAALALMEDGQVAGKIVIRP